MVMAPKLLLKNTQHNLHDFSHHVDHTLSSDSVVILPKNYAELLLNDNPQLTTDAQFRNSRTGGTRSTRTQIDHDVFEGLPVRHWHKKAINVSTAPEKENSNDMKARNLALPELEMPRDYHLLSELSQNLLRAARMPQAKKTSTVPSMEDDKEAGDDEDVDGDLDTGFVAKRWAIVPKDQEGPEPEFLAKRRKGMPSIHGGAMAALGTSQQMRKTKIRKAESGGGSSVLDVLVPEGQTVDGEIYEDETSPTQAPEPGTVVEGVGVANAEGVVIAGDQPIPVYQKRRPPPPKRKAKGPGRGKKKRVAFAGPDGKPTAGESIHLSNGNMEIEGAHTVDGGQGLLEGDRVIDDDSTLQDGEDGSEEGDDEDREEGELSPSPSLPNNPSQSTHAIAADTQTSNETIVINGFESAPQPLPSSTDEVGNTMKSSDQPDFETVSENVVRHTTQTFMEPLPGLMLQHPDDTTDQMPLQESIRPDVGESPPVPVHEPSALSPESGLPDNSNITDPRVAGQSLSEIVTESSKEPQEPQELAEGVITGGSVEAKEILEAMQPAIDELSNQDDTGTHALQETVNQLIADLPAENRTELGNSPELRSASKASHVVVHGSSTEPSMTTIEEHAQEPAAEVSTGSVPEGTSVSISKQTIEVTPESSNEAIPDTLSQFPEHGDVDSMQETVRQDDIQQATEQVLNPSPEPVCQATPPVPAEPSPSPMTDYVEEPIPPIAEEIETEPVPQSALPKPLEIQHDPLVETAERSFSFQRPTGSPKAPTPSPPTPIENKFSLQPPYYSPKAPTMSPPTPLDRSRASSPDIPLSEQKFELPPPLNAAMDGAAIPGLVMQEIPNSERFSVEAAPQVQPQVNAQIPVEHNPLDGMAQPKAADQSVGGSESREQPVVFSDGEEDLLGSLERSLDQRGHR